MNTDYGCYVPDILYQRLSDDLPTTEAGWKQRQEFLDEQDSAMTDFVASTNSWVKENQEELERYVEEYDSYIRNIERRSRENLFEEGLVWCIERISAIFARVTNGVVLFLHRVKSIPQIAYQISQDLAYKVRDQVIIIVALVTSAGIFTLIHYS